MTRWFAPVAAGVSLLVLLVGLVRAEADTATTAGVSLTFWGLAGLALVAAGVGAVELSAARRAQTARAGAARRRVDAGPRPPRVS